MIKLNEVQMARLKEYERDISEAQQKMTAFLDGASLGLGIDTSKKYDFDMKTGVFKEVEKEKKDNV